MPTELLKLSVVDVYWGWVHAEVDSKPFTGLEVLGSQPMKAQAHL